MAEPTKTPKQMLVESLDPRIPQLVSDARGVGGSWDEIATVVNTQLAGYNVNVKVSRESLREWYGTPAATP